MRDNWRSHATKKQDKEPMPEPDHFKDSVAGLLSPIIYSLNKGKDIKSGSKEHKELKELLNRCNNS